MYYQTGIPNATKEQCLKEFANKSNQKIITITKQETITIDDIEYKLEVGDKVLISKKG